jgi:hypothetical protein
LRQFEKISCHRENEREKAIAFTAELLETYGVSDETMPPRKAVDGKDSVLVEITSISGYYTYKLPGPECLSYSLQKAHDHMRT